MILAETRAQLRSALGAPTSRREGAQVPSTSGREGAQVPSTARQEGAQVPSTSGREGAQVPSNGRERPPERAPRARWSHPPDGYLRPVVLVPTMGALHEGHARLLQAAVSRPGLLVASVFVNPLQFGPAEDLARYPRTLDEDLELCREQGVDVVFAPSPAEIYPSGEPLVTVDPGPLGAILEGASRPGHFRGVLTVVAKLLGLVRPDVAVFGQKDYQQLRLIAAMVDELCMPVEVVGAQTVRDDDGLALSSRNRYLGAAERTAALSLSRALSAGRSAAAAGPKAVLAAAESVLAAEPDVVVDYLSLRSADLSEPGECGEARLLVAARVGTTRLIDNVVVELGDAPGRPGDRAT